MNKKLLSLIGCLLLLSAHSMAQPVLMHYWNFNQLAPTVTQPVLGFNLPSVAADYTDSMLFGHVGSIRYTQTAGTSTPDTTYFDTVTGNSINAKLSSPAGKAINLHNPSTNMEARIYVPAGGYKDVVFGFGGQTKNGGNVLKASYSIDSGATWLTAGIKSINGSGSNTADTIILTPAAALITIAFDSTVNNNNKFVIRLQFTGNTTNSNGSNVLDNVSLTGTKIKLGVNQVNGLSEAITVYPNPATASVTINTNTAGEKNVYIYNAAGQVVYHATSAAQKVTLPVSRLPVGIYHITAIDAATGKQYVAKFLKE